METIQDIQKKVDTKFKTLKLLENCVRKKSPRKKAPVRGQG